MVDLNGVSSLYGANGGGCSSAGPLKEFSMICGVFLREMDRKLPWQVIWLC